MAKKGKNRHCLAWLARCCPGQARRVTDANSHLQRMYLVLSIHVALRTTYARSLKENTKVCTVWIEGSSAEKKVLDVHVIWFIGLNFRNLKHETEVASPLFSNDVLRSFVDYPFRGLFQYDFV